MKTIKGIHVGSRSGKERALFLPLDEAKEDFIDTAETLISNDNISDEEYRKMMELIELAEFEEILKVFGDLIAAEFPAITYSVVYN